MPELNKSNLRDLLGSPSFYSAKTFTTSKIVSDSLLQISRTPHPYGFVFSSVGSAPHLLDLEGEGDFEGLMHATGVDLADPAPAMRRAVFELLERIWGFGEPRRELVRSTRKALADKALDPGEFGLLSDFEYARLDGHFVEYSDQLELDWVACQGLVSPSAVSSRLVPAALAYQGYGHRHPEQRFVPTLSTGLAAGTRYDDALMRAICEVVERDAFMVRWLGRIAPPVIEDARSLFSDEVAETVEMLNEDGFSVSFHDLTLDVPIPVVMTNIRNEKRPEAPVNILGLGCAPSATGALVKAFRESVSMMTNWYDCHDGSSFHRNEYLSKASREQKYETERFVGGKQTSTKHTQIHDANGDGETMPGGFIAMLEKLGQAGYSVYYCDLTPGIDEVPDDFVLVRALMPGLQPMLYENNSWRLKNDRLFKRISQLTPGSKRLSESNLNLQINPFAVEEVG